MRPGRTRLLEQSGGADRKLRRDEDNRARVGCRDDASAPCEHVLHIGPIVGIDRSVVGDPDHVGAPQRLVALVGELQGSGGELSSDEVGKPRLVDRQNAFRETHDDGLVLVEGDDSMSRVRDTGCRDNAEMPETGDANLHWSPPTGRVVSPLASAARFRLHVMPTSPDSYAALYLREVGEIVQSVDPAAVDELAYALADVRRGQGRLFILGVGGGAAHASHAVNDFRKLCDFEAYAPTDNVAEITARTNDEGWETTFDAWLRTSRLSSRDAILVFSVGGGSRAHNVSVNLVRAIELAQEVGARVFGVVGRADGATAEAADVCIVVEAPPERRTPHVEEFQAIVWHLLVSHPALVTAPGKWESVEAADGR